MNLYFTTPAMTIFVKLDKHENIQEIAPILKMFLGQPFYNLTKWAIKKWGKRVEWYRIDGN